MEARRRAGLRHWHSLSETRDREKFIDDSCMDVVQWSGM